MSNCVSRQLAVPKERLVQQVFRSNNISRKEIPCLVYLPRSYYSDQWKDLPLVLFLHGRGERGADLELLKKQGLPKMIAEEKAEFPFILVAPQLPATEEEWYTKDLMALLDEVKSDYPVDEDRIYLTGLSLGGNGAWKLAVEFPDAFAAVVPISGWGEASHICRLRNANVWAFHGAKDTLIAPEKTLDIIERLQLCNPSVKCTVYPNAKHDAWTETYHNAEFMNWLMGQKRKKGGKKNPGPGKAMITETKPLRIVAIGDSVGISLSWGLDESVQANYHLTLDNFSKVSSGLTYPKYHNWHEKLDEILSLKKYDLGIVMMGANDAQCMTADQKQVCIFSPEWKQEYKARVKAIVERFAKDNMKLYWVELPPMGPEPYSTRIKFINACVKEAAEEFRFSYIQTSGILGNEKGGYAKYLPYRGKITLMRSTDDIHMTKVAAKLVADEILRRIYAEYYFPE